MALVLAACSSGSVPTTMLGDPSEADVVIEVVYADGLATGVEPVVEVSLGDAVTITITSDTEDELHIHGGYDLFVFVPGSSETSISFVADHLGVFLVELEVSGYPLFEIDVG